MPMPRAGPAPWLSWAVIAPTAAKTIPAAAHARPMAAAPAGGVSWLIMPSATSTPTTRLAPVVATRAAARLA